MAADVELLPLPERFSFMGWKTHMRDYARANVAHATAAKDAEIEDLRADLADYMRIANTEATRAERLAEALREAKGRMLGQVKWVACDCGCELDKPADAVSVAWLRAIALLRDQEEGK
jgi:hypothetical protein